MDAAGLGRHAQTRDASSEMPPSFIGISMRAGCGLWRYQHSLTVSLGRNPEFMGQHSCKYPRKKLTFSIMSGPTDQHALTAAAVHHRLVNKIVVWHAPSRDSEPARVICTAQHHSFALQNVCRSSPQVHTTVSCSVAAISGSAGWERPCITPFPGVRRHVASLVICTTIR